MEGALKMGNQTRSRGTKIKPWIERGLKIFLGSINMTLCISVIFSEGIIKIFDLWIEGDWIFHTCRAALQIEGRAALQIEGRVFFIDVLNGKG